MPKSDRTSDIQYGALPYRISAHTVEVMLITSRETKRWVIPKGWPMMGKKPHKVAEIEAFQEAGIKGVIRNKPVGVYPYSKIMPDGESRLCFVAVFPLRVTLEKVTWRETAERHRQWFPQDDAADLVDEGALAQIINGWR
jgi:ADP-ribose pyrophosphatase YjhB (NUDIX family)